MSKHLILLFAMFFSILCACNKKPEQPAPTPPQKSNVDKLLGTYNVEGWFIVEMYHNGQHGFYKTIDSTSLYFKIAFTKASDSSFYVQRGQSNNPSFSTNSDPELYSIDDHCLLDLHNKDWVHYTAPQYNGKTCIHFNPTDGDIVFTEGYSIRSPYGANSRGLYFKK